MATDAAIKVLRDAREAGALLHPLRLRLVENLKEADSAAGLARKLGLPRQQINYHLHELEKTGLIEFVAERKKGNCTERIVRAVARTYLISPEAIGPLAADPERVADRFSASYLVAIAARAIRDLAVLQPRADKAKKKLATLSLLTEVRFATAADLNAFSEELVNDIAQLVAKYHNQEAPAGRLFRFFLGAYPALTRKEEESPDSAGERQENST